MAKHGKNRAKTKEDLPRGVLFSDLHKAKGAKIGARWYWRVWDKVRKKYVAQAWEDFDQGKTWAIDQHHKLAVGLETSAGASVGVIGKAYITALNARGATERYQGSVQQVIDGLVEAGATDMKDPLFPDRVEAWLGDLQARRNGQRKGTPASPALRNMFLTITRALVADAMKRRLLAYDPLAVLRRWKTDTKSKPVFTVAELRTLLSDESQLAGHRERQRVVDAVAEHKGDKRAAAKALKVHLATVYNQLNQEPTTEDPWWLYTAMAVYLGARPTEVRHIRWSHIDWHNMDVVLPADHPGNKTNTERRIPILGELAEILRDRKQEGDDCILGDSVSGIREDTATKAFQAYVGRCGVSVQDKTKRNRGPHSLRHNCGALLTACGFQDMAVLLHLGHDNVAVSKEYRRLAPAFKTDVAAWGREFRLRTAAVLGPH